MEHALRAHDLNRNVNAEMRRAAVDSANVTIRSLILVNGGAVVALLAFVGALESGDINNAIKIEALVAPIRWFAFGVGFSAVTAALAYLVNMLDSDITDSVELIWKYPYVVSKKQAKWLGWLRLGAHISALALAIAALVAFFLGIISVTEAISHLGL